MSAWPDDMVILSDLYSRRRSFPAAHEMVHQGQIEKSAYVLVSGWAFTYKVLSNGARQVVDFQIPGDFLNLRSMLFYTTDQTVETITPLQACLVKQYELLKWFHKTPRLATAVLWAASRDEAMVVERLVDLGRRTASERVAHFLLELGARLRLVGIGDSSGFACPLTQYLLADALGLSPVHMNRVLRELREDGMVTFQNGQVIFDDYESLVEHSGFDRTYLDQDRPLLR